MRRLGLYRFLMGTLGVALVLFGLALVASFFLYQRPNSIPLVPTGPIGQYFVAFTGCALLAWGGAMVGAARDPFSTASRTIGTSTALVFVVMALVRMVAWAVGDYAGWFGELPRKEAALLLILALLLVWLRPTVAETIAGGATIRGRRSSDRAARGGPSSTEGTAEASSA